MTCDSFADFVPGTALCDPRCEEFVAGAALGEPRSADLVALRGEDCAALAATPSAVGRNYPPARWTRQTTWAGGAARTDAEQIERTLTLCWAPPGARLSLETTPIPHGVG